MKITNEALEQIAEKNMPMLVSRLEKDEELLKKINKGNVKVEDVETLKAEIEAEMKSIKGQLTAIELGLTERKNFENNVDKDGTFGFNSLQEFIAHDFIASVGGDVDPRLEKVKKYQKEKERSMLDAGMTSALGMLRNTKAAGTGPIAGDSTFGGGLIPSAFGGVLLQQSMEATGLWDKMTPMPMSVPSIDWQVPDDSDHSSGAYYGGIFVSSLGENEAIPERRPKWDKVRIDLNATALISAPSNKLITFSPVSIEAMLREMMTTALQGWMVDKFINGLGAGEPLGILNTTGVQGIEIAKESAQIADTINIDNVMKMDARFYSTVPSGIWIANYNTKIQLRKLHQVIGVAGVPIYEYASGNQKMDSLLSRQIVYTEYAQKLGDKGDIMLVDPTQYFRAYLATGPQWSTSTDIYFLYDQTAIRLVFYCDARPKRVKAITPRYATTDTMSPYIALAERA